MYYLSLSDRIFTLTFREHKMANCSDITMGCLHRPCSFLSTNFYNVIVTVKETKHFTFVGPNTQDGKW